MALPGILTKSISILLLVFLLACSGEEKPESKSKPEEQKPAMARPNFNADSAYHFVAQQVGFGPRVPNTDAHKKTGDWLSKKLAAYGFDVTEQKAQVTAFNGSKLNITNIIGSHFPDKNNRVLLFAHWDTRPFADQDVKDKNKAIDGANDGASGVGVLLEVARQIQKMKLEVGVDIIFFDAEDYGQPSNSFTPRKEKTWCLGSQYWSKNPHVPNYTANYGILLDMVGAKNAFFTKEGFSRYYAPHVVEKVWNVAKQLGHGKHFVFQETNHVGEDDHVYVNSIRKIPSIDIIQFDPQTGAFAPHWHTHDDNLEVIDKNTLRAVGETVLGTLIQGMN